MPATHRLRVKLNAGAWQTGGVVAALGDTVALSPDNTVGVTSYRYEIFDYPPGFTCPAGWSTDANGVYYSTAATPPDFALDAVEWGKYALRLTVNGGLSEVIVGKSTRVQADPLLIDEETAIKVESALGVGGLMQRERNQFGGVDWTRAYNEDIRALEAAVAGVSANATDWKESVQVATTVALPAYTRVGNVITANANGALPAIDGATLTPGTRRLLLWHGAAGADNGTYDVTAVGDAGNPFVLTRTVDADGNTEAFTAETHVPIMAGTAHAGKTFRLVTDDPITMNVTALTFVAATGVPDGTATGQVLKWNGTAWIAGAADLADTDAITGILAVANGGTGLAAIGAANTVAKVNAAGTLLEYGKLVSANLDAAAGIVGTQLSAAAAIAATQLAAGAAGTVLIGGASNSFSATPIVTSLTAGATAATGAVLAAASLTFGIDVSAPNITHTAAANGQTPTDLVIQAQSAHASSGGAARKGADLLLKPGTTTSGGTASRVRMWSGYTGGGTAEIFNFYYDSPTSTAVLTTISGSIVIQPPASATTYIRAGTASGDIVLDTMQTTGNVRVRTGPGADPVFLANNKNAAFFTATGSYGGGVGVIFGANATTEPTSDPSGGGLAWWYGGAFKGRGSSGTVTTIAAAEPHCPRCGNDYVFEAKNDKRGHHVAICWTCFLGEADAHGLDRSKFAFIDKLGKAA